MISFLKRVGLFLVVLTAVVVVNTMINKRMERSHPFRVNENQNKIVAGDSHTMTGVNPAILGNTRNISQMAEPYPVTYFKLKDVIRNNPTIDTVFLGLSYHNLSSFNDDKFKHKVYSTELLNRAYSVIPLKNQLQLFEDKRLTLTTFLKSYGSIPFRSHHKHIGTFKETENNLDNASLDNKINWHFYKNDGEERILSELCTRYLDSIMNFCATESVELIGLDLPVHNAYKERIPVTFKHNFDSVLVNRYPSLKVIRYSDDIEDRFFKDYDHLNRDGATLFTNSVKTWLNE